MCGRLTQRLVVLQVVALVTEGAQRPELPAPEDLPGSGSFEGYSEYILLMEQCWDQDPAARPTFAQVTLVPALLLAPIGLLCKCGTILCLSRYVQQG